MDDRLEQRTFAIEDRHWWYAGRRDLIHAVVGGLDVPSRGRLLDAGCGSGRNMVELARYGEVVGVDDSAVSVAAARERNVGEVLQASLDEPLPLPTAAFDLAVALDVLEHLQDDRRALAELARVVRPRGWLVATVPQYPWLRGDHDAPAHHLRRYTRATLLAAAARAGWEQHRLTSFNALLLTPIAAARMAQRVRGGRPRRSDLSRTPEVLNGLLRRVLAAESAAVRRGHDLPFGVTLLAVLRRSAGSPGRPTAREPA